MDFYMRHIATFFLLLSYLLSAQISLSRSICLEFISKIDNRQGNDDALLSNVEKGGHIKINGHPIPGKLIQKAYDKSSRPNQLDYEGYYLAIYEFCFNTNILNIKKNKVQYGVAIVDRITKSPVPATSDNYFYLNSFPGNGAVKISSAIEIGKQSTNKFAYYTYEQIDPIGWKRAREDAASEFMDEQVKLRNDLQNEIEITKAAVEVNKQIIKDEEAITRASRIENKNKLREADEENEKVKRNIGSLYPALQILMKKRKEALENPIPADSGLSGFNLRTPENTPEFIKLKSTIEHYNYVKNELDSSDVADSEAKQTFLELANSGIVIADEYYFAGEESDGDEALNFAKNILDLGLSFTPGVGWGKDVYEAATGRNLVTGEELDDFGRAAAVIGVVTVGFGSKIMKGLATLRKIKLRHMNILSWNRAIDGAGNIANSAKKYGFTSLEKVQGFTKNVRKSTDSNFSQALYPRGPGASSAPVPTGHTKVSRWMNDAEVKAWYEGGGTRIPPDIGANSRLYVTKAGAPKPGGTGNVRVDFHVPDHMLQRAGNDQWHQILQPEASTPIYNVEIFLP